MPGCAPSLCCHRRKPSKHAEVEKELEAEEVAATPQKLVSEQQISYSCSRQSCSKFSPSVTVSRTDQSASDVSRTSAPTTTVAATSQLPPDESTSGVTTSSGQTLSETVSNRTTIQVSPEDGHSPASQGQSSIVSQGLVTVIKIENPSPSRPITVFDPTQRFTTPTSNQRELKQEERAVTQLTMASEQLTGLLARLEAVTSRLEKIDSGAGDQKDAAAASPFVEAFDKIISGAVAKTVALGKSLSDEQLTKQMCLVQDAFNKEKAFLEVASRCKQPSQDVLAKLLQPISECMTGVVEIKETNRKSPFFNHLSAVAEGIAALGWVAITSKPWGYVKDTSEGGDFYGNRIIKDYKEKDAKHLDFAKGLKTMWQELGTYVKEFHTTGVLWNRQGVDATAAPAGGAPPPPPPAGGAPPPPPPPAVLPPAPAASSGGDEDSAKRSALFDALNKGTDISKGLKKVTDDMKTHKNPSLRSGPAPYKPPVSAKPGSKPAPKAPVAVAKKPPVFELQGKKWVVEHQENNRGIVISETETKQTVYIYKCVNTTIEVKNKVNSITLDGCKKCAVVCDDLIASMEFINCASVQFQVRGKVPTVSIDKTDGCQVFLSKDSLHTEIISSKSSEMNIVVPTDDGDVTEMAIPEQYKTTYDGKRLNTVIADV